MRGRLPDQAHLEALRKTDAGLRERLFYDIATAYASDPQFASHFGNRVSLLIRPYPAAELYDTNPARQHKTSLQRLITSEIHWDELIQSPALMDPLLEEASRAQFVMDGAVLPLQRGLLVKAFSPLGSEFNRKFLRDFHRGLLGLDFEKAFKDQLIRQEALRKDIRLWLGHLRANSYYFQVPLIDPVKDQDYWTIAYHLGQQFKSEKFESTVRRYESEFKSLWIFASKPKNTPNELRRLQQEFQKSLTNKAINTHRNLNKIFAYIDPEQSNFILGTDFGLEIWNQIERLLENGPEAAGIRGTDAEKVNRAIQQFSPGQLLLSFSFPLVPILYRAWDLKEARFVQALRKSAEIKHKDIALPALVSRDSLTPHWPSKIATDFLRIYFCNQFDGKGLTNINGQLMHRPPAEGSEDSESCRTCHGKLKGPKRVARENGKFSSPVQIQFDDAEGHLQSFIASSASEFRLRIRENPVYIKCQIRHFWNWFIGDDVPLNADRLLDLERSYRQARSIQEFARAVVLVPEFYQPPARKQEPVTFQSVRNTLAACTNCHNIEVENRVPSLTELPFKLPLDERTHKQWLSSLIKQTDLRSNGANATMPPSDEPRLDTHELKALARWIMARAPDDHGHPSISADERDELFEQFSEEQKLNLVAPVAAKLKNDLNFRRLLSPTQLLSSLVQITNLSPAAVGDRCTAMSTKNVDRGDETFLRPVWAQCVEQFTDQDFNISKIISPSTAKALIELYVSRNQDYPDDDLNSAFVIRNMTWRGLPEYLRETLLRECIRFVFHPDFLQPDQESALLVLITSFISQPTETKLSLRVSLRHVIKTLLTHSYFMEL